MFDESICQFRAVESIVRLLFYFWWKILFPNDVDPDQIPQHVASDPGLYYLRMNCLRMALLRVSQ